MEVWTIVVMVILGLLLATFIFLTVYTENSNKKKQQENILYPFSGSLTPPSDTAPPPTGAGLTPQDGLVLVKKDGKTPQISCPKGYKVNIVGAFLDVVDPYNTCGPRPDSTYQRSCGIVSDVTSLASCEGQGQSTCGDGMECVAGKCRPTSCTNPDGSNPNNDMCAGSGQTQACLHNPDGTSTCLKSEVGSIQGTFRCTKTGDTSYNWIMDPTLGQCMYCRSDGTNPGYCAQAPICSNINSNGQNSVCVNPNYGCRPRDASAYLAAHCDGEKECLGIGDAWVPNSSVNNWFGPLPCKISAAVNDPNYKNLPVSAGWGGGVPNDSKDTSAAKPASFQQGYYVHGIYTCVPDDEKAKAE